MTQFDNEKELYSKTGSNEIACENILEILDYIKSDHLFHFVIETHIYIKYVFGIYAHNWTNPVIQVHIFEKELNFYEEIIENNIFQGKFNPS